ncbi:MAG TPA: NAD(+) synthase [Candidatus Glassbacteria bacterium]|nr:NAD(+) synthase [Candidatus Glassbacteria bacterium]
MKTNLPYETMVFNIRTELETYLRNKNLKSLVLGISGGIDSALCVALARPVCDKLGIPLIGRSIPITTNTSDERDRAELVGNAFCTNFDEDYQMEGVYATVWSALKEAGWDLEDPKEKIRQGNIKARMRMIRIYDLAQLYNGMVLSTDNLTELLLGFWTLHGDVGDYGMIQSLWKTEVYDMSEYLVSILPPDQAKALQSCIDCQATDGLGISGTDLDQILPEWKGSSRDGYAEVDKILQKYTEDGSGDPNHPVIKRHLATEFKRTNPFNIRRSLIILKPRKPLEKKMITVDVHHHNGDKPYNKEYLDKLNLLPDDVISVSYEEEEYRSDGGSPAGWYISVQRTRIETDEEFEKRVKENKEILERLKEGRYQRYLDLKKEFES